MGLCRVPLQKMVVNENVETIIIDRPDPKEDIAHKKNLFSHIRGFPSKRNVDQGYQSMKLLHMARFECESSYKIFS